MISPSISRCFRLADPSIEYGTATLISAWAQQQQIPGINFTQINGRYVLPKSKARYLFTELEVSTGVVHPFIALTNNHAYLLDSSTRYGANNSPRYKAACQAGMTRYAQMTGSIKLLTPGDILKLMLITPGLRYERAAEFRKFLGVNLTTPAHLREVLSNV